MSAGEMALEDGLLAEPQDVAEEDVFVPVPESRPVPERMLAISASTDYVLDLRSGPPVADRLPRGLDRIADDVIAAHTLSRQRDEDATTARQSA